MTSDLALDHRILQIMLGILNKEFEYQSVFPDRKRWLVLLEAYLVVCFPYSLCGNEGFMVEFSE